MNRFLTSCSFNCLIEYIGVQEAHRLGIITAIVLGKCPLRDLTIQSGKFLGFCNLHHPRTIVGSDRAKRRGVRNRIFCRVERNLSQHERCRHVRRNRHRLTRNCETSRTSTTDTIPISNNVQIDNSQEFEGSGKAALLTV